jgi:hypothetical protein
MSYVTSNPVYDHNSDANIYTGGDGITISDWGCDGVDEEGDCIPIATPGVGAAPEYWAYCRLPFY